MFMASDEKVALITGGGSGIGQEAALALQQIKYRVVVVARRRAPLEKTVALSEGRGPEMTAITADISNPQQVTALFSELTETFRRLDLLFNNAGVGIPSVATEDLTFDDWKKTIDTNLTGAFLCAQSAIRIMKKQSPRGGRIINNGSVSAHVPRPHSVAYTATKHAVTGLTKSLALDGRQHDIACSQIDIGNADTEIAAQMKIGMPQPNGETMPEPVINPIHCGEAVAYIANLPLDTNVLFMTVMATKMPYVGRG